ncbi:MAG: ubiquinol-cytochrome c reductase iron-sulfur subunit [Candidatus Bipolaricaulia bacterium]
MDEGTSRRSFLRRLLGGTLVVGTLGVLGSALAYVFPPARRFPRAGSLRVGEESSVPLGEGELVIFNGQPVWVLHIERGFTALSALCTHEGCLLEWEEERKVLSCPCHMGLFDTKGNVLAGLPPRALPRYRVAVRGGAIYLSEGRG